MRENINMIYNINDLSNDLFVYNILEIQLPMKKQLPINIKLG